MNALTEVLYSKIYVAAQPFLIKITKAAYFVSH